MGDHAHVAIIGSGFGGLGAAIQLKRDGIDDFTILERADDVGGTWRDNSYPGCACDVQSNLYSFSFAPNPAWSNTYSRQPEIWRYLRHTAERFGVLPHVRFGTEMTNASWDDRQRLWRIDTSRGSLTARVLVSAAGPLCEPAIPALPGLETFAGTTFHSARWRHDHDLTGRRVAVIGTGASAIQFVPRIAPEVAALDLYQRTAPWIVPRRDRAVRPGAKRLFRTVPPAQRLLRLGTYALREAFFLNFRTPGAARVAERIALRHLARQVPDPALRATLRPRYAIGCKRVLVSDDYLPALSRDNVSLITERITEVRPNAIITADGVARQIDTIIFGTGFHVSDTPIAERIRGDAGRSLAEVWQGSPRAHRGTTVAGFPNLFLLLGPNTGLGHTSVLIMIEAQLGYLSKALRHLSRADAVALTPRPGAQAAWVDRVDRLSRGTVWLAGGCASWYLDSTGRNSALWPRTTFSFRRQLARFHPAEYDMVR